ncbi:MAG TPA: LysR family transcriptional regulator [Plantibacter sp.]|uniref:LysR family transcriptional regulator n=1 Tax=unclassified Plantibacter TaxID=2624265 RepID=UPI002CE21CF7|nr:LysR family transcriptional regulator [Plantibacter sp.]
MNLEQLEAIVAVVDYGSYAAAADVLRISQPSLTRRIQRCEADLGLALFTRVGRRMQVTDAGRSVLGPARRMLREASGLRALVDAQHELTTGTLRIGALPSLVATHVPELVARFHQAHPDVRIEVTGAADSSELLEALDLGRIEIGVADLRDAGPGVEVRLLEEQAFAVVLPGIADPGERDQDQHEPVTAQELRAHSLVTLPRGTSMRAVTDEAYARLGVQPPRVIVTTQREALTRFATAGVGLTVVPERLAGWAAANGARVRRFPTPVTRSIGLLVRRDAVDAPAIHAFLRLADAPTSERGAGETV